MEFAQVLNCSADMATIVAFIKAVLGIIQIGIPIILIIMGSIDLGKAVLSSDEKEIKGATGKLIKRCIAAIAVFFVFTIVSLVMGLVADNGPSDINSSDWRDCWKAADNKNNQR